MKRHWAEKAMEIIDGYCHCGLNKYEPIERVAEVMSSADVSRAVLVQHLGEFDNSYLAGIAAAEPRRFAAVCLVDHQPNDCIATLNRWADTGCFKGIRLSTEALAARPDLADASADLSLIIVLYAPQGVAPAARVLGDLFKRRPDARLVVSHLGKPNPADSPRFAKWGDTLRLVEHQGVYLQLSGMKMFCPWPHEPLYPLIEQAVERFGPSRIYWGSNFPVVGDAIDYRNDLSLIAEGKLPMASGDIAAIVGQNAKRLWFASVE